MSEFASCLSPATRFEPQQEPGRLLVQKTVLKAASLARALVHDDDPAFTRRRAIPTSAGPATISVTKFGGPMETPTMLGAVYIEEGNRLVVETHGIGFPYSAFRERPDLWCGVAGIAITGSIDDPETGSLLLTPHLAPNRVEEGYFLDQAIDDTDEGARGFDCPGTPYDPREDHNALLVVSAFRNVGHVFAHPAMNEALQTLPLVSAA